MGKIKSGNYSFWDKYVSDGGFWGEITSLIGIGSIIHGVNVENYNEKPMKRYVSACSALDYEKEHGAVLEYTAGSSFWGKEYVHEWQQTGNFTEMKKVLKEAEEYRRNTFYNKMTQKGKKNKLKNVWQRQKNIEYKD